MIQVTMLEWTILTFIRDYRQRQGYCPSTAEVKDGCGLRNRYLAYRTLNRMKAKGLVRFGGKEHRDRTIVLCKVGIEVQP